MEKAIIEVKNIGKKYNISHQRGGYVALRDVIAGVFKTPFKFLKQKVKQVTGFKTKEEFWALKGVNFEIKKGEVVGIIGRNGAGKSTLLKILSQITPPTEGEIKIYGRVGSLLEVGTGFHPELTGRENIFLNGAILGMTKKEIVRKFDEIVAFAGIDRFLDTPVKHYSSGMYVRLAFSVAAHMEPDILIIDEVLAVGDAEFQKKCLGKMEEITKGEGRTILFVSHNMGAVQQLCKKSILLKEGKVDYIGPTETAISKYMDASLNKDSGKMDLRKFNGSLSSKASFTDIYINDGDGFANIKPSSAITIKAKGEIIEEIELFNVSFSVYAKGIRLFTTEDVETPSTIKKGLFESEIVIPAYMLRPGNYSIGLGGWNERGDWLYAEDVGHFNILEEWDMANKEAHFGIINIPVKGKRTIHEK